MFPLAKFFTERVARVPSDVTDTHQSVASCHDVNVATIKIDDNDDSEDFMTDNSV